MKKVIALMLSFLFLPIFAFADLQVHFLDVGQGDCTVVLCDGKAMVIDGGPASASSFVYSYIKNTLDLQHVDYIISTHPHLDHVYGLSAILNAVPVDLILTPVLEWDSKAFNSIQAYINKTYCGKKGDTLAQPM